VIDLWSHLITNMATAEFKNSVWWVVQEHPSASHFVAPSQSVSQSARPPRFECPDSMSASLVCRQYGSCFTRCCGYSVSVQAVCTYLLACVLSAGKLHGRSQYWPPPCLSLLYEDLPCRASPCPQLRTFSLSWLRKTCAYVDKIVQIWSFARRSAIRE